MTAMPIETVGAALRSHFNSWLGVSAAIVGILGVYFIVKEVSQYLDETFPTWAIILISLSLILLWLSLSLAKFGHNYFRKARHLELLLSQPRGSQQQAFNAFSRVYGWQIENFQRTVRIYGDQQGRVEYEGRADSDYHITLLGTTRAISSWSRHTRSKAADPLQTHEVTIDQPGVTATLSSSELVSGVRVEQITFSPSLRRHHAAQLHMTRPSPPGTFRVREQITASGAVLNGDYLAFTPHEPIKKLELKIEFHNAEVANLRAEARVGPGAVPLPRETVDLEEVMVIERSANVVKATLEVDYPAIGITYRVVWDNQETS